MLYSLETLMEKERQFQLILVSQVKELFESYAEFAKQCIFTATGHLRISNQEAREAVLLIWQCHLANTGTQAQTSKLSQKIHVSNKKGRALRSSPSHMEVSRSSTGNGWPPQTDWDIKIAGLCITLKGAHKCLHFQVLHCQIEALQSHYWTGKTLQ